MIPAITWENDRLVLLDQRYLPERIEYVHCRDFREIAAAIRDMVVRGAPAIGIAGGYAMAAAVRECAAQGVHKPERGSSSFEAFLRDAAKTISAARPTAVNLMWAVDRVLGKVLTELSSMPPANAASDSREAPAATSAINRA